MTATLSKFILNTDYTSIKEDYSFDYTLNVSDTIVQAWDGATRQIDIPVPDGIYFENVTMRLSTTGVTSPTPFVVMARELGEDEFYQIVVSLLKISKNAY